MSAVVLRTCYLSNVSIQLIQSLVMGSDYLFALNLLASIVSTPCLLTRGDLLNKKKILIEDIDKKFWDELEEEFLIIKWMRLITPDQ